MQETREKVMPDISESVFNSLIAAVGLDNQTCEEAVEILKEWQLKQPHLPNDIDERRLLRRLITCKGSIQRTKNSIDMYYTLRTAVPEILCNRDPKMDWFQEATSYNMTIPLPRLTEKWERVTIRKLLKYDSLYSPFDDMKVQYMIADMRFIHEACSGDIMILDCEGVTPGMMIKFTPPLMKKLHLISFKAYNVRLRGIHLINLPPFSDLILALIKTTITKPKLRDRIHLHKGLESLHEFVDKKILPEELGGDAGPIRQHWDLWKKFLLENRDWFVAQEELKSDESKRPGQAISSVELFGFEGSFRKLNID